MRVVLTEEWCSTYNEGSLFSEQPVHSYWRNHHVTILYQTIIGSSPSVGQDDWFGFFSHGKNHSLAGVRTIEAYGTVWRQHSIVSECDVTCNYPTRRRLTRPRLIAEPVPRGQTSQCCVWLHEINRKQQWLTAKCAGKKLFQNYQKRKGRWAKDADLAMPQRLSYVCSALCL